MTTKITEAQKDHVEGEILDDMKRETIDDVLGEQWSDEPRPYKCFIKSHSEAPDFEMEVEACHIDDAVSQIMEKVGKLGWEKEDIEKNTQLI